MAESTECECRAVPEPHPNDWSVRAYRWVFWLLFVVGGCGSFVALAWWGITTGASIAIYMLVLVLFVIAVGAVMRELLAIHAWTAQKTPYPTEVR